MKKHFGFALAGIILISSSLVSCSKEDEFYEPDDWRGESRPPETAVVLINELRTTFVTPKAEFVELRVLSAGTLDGLSLFIMSNTPAFVYEFPPVLVQKDELVVLHLRTLNVHASRDELTGNLNESGGEDASPTARDLWVAGNTKRLRSTDAVYVADREGRVLSAVMIFDEQSPPANMNFFHEALEFLYGQGAWTAKDGGKPGLGDAVSTSSLGTTPTRSISRDESVENTNTAADWYVSLTVNNVHGATPGRPNNPAGL
ncbi:MAG: hypothetical protein FWG66_00875 [Spirochaetes bacterium]|nr:hypothetical protein [Spirochaetota bacterium]